MISDKLRKVLDISSNIAKPFEGLMKVVHDMVEAYHDPVGYPTIGYGHLLSKIKYEDLSKYKKLTFEEADETIENDMIHALNRALTLSPVLASAINTYRLASIADFVFNCGDGNYSISTLKKRVDEERWSEAAEEILRWDKACGKKLPGLTRRRIAESKFLLLNYED